jgi:hypothetical protein
MKIQRLCFSASLTLACASAALAQSNDVAYCKALASKYQTYLSQGSGGRHGGTDSQNIDARVAANKCDAGDTSGVPVLERALKDAKIELPKRT